MLKNLHVQNLALIEDADIEFSEGLNIARTTVDTPVNVVLSNSFGFGGTNSALIIKKL